RDLERHNYARKRTRGPLPDLPQALLPRREAAIKEEARKLAAARERRASEEPRVHEWRDDGGCTSRRSAAGEDTRRPMQVGRTTESENGSNGRARPWVRPNSAEEVRT